jgi:cytochrome bd-type quinol oxidase subunit 2
MKPESNPALTVGSASTRTALADWAASPLRTLARWFAGSALAASLLLVGTLIVSEVTPGTRQIDLAVPPVHTGGAGYVLTILGHNFLVLALHAMACVAGYIAGASVPDQAEQMGRVRRRAYEFGAKLAIAFVVAATLFSICNQVWDLGTAASGVAHELHSSPALLLVALLPHAGPELLALFLPLAAWVSASRRRAWDELLAAALVTTAIAVPILIAAAVWESYGAAQVIRSVTGH